MPFLHFYYCYAECHLAKCHYAECRGATFTYYNKRLAAEESKQTSTDGAGANVIKHFYLQMILWANKLECWLLQISSIIKSRAESLPLEWSRCTTVLGSGLTCKYQTGLKMIAIPISLVHEKQRKYF